MIPTRDESLDKGIYIFFCALHNVVQVHNDVINELYQNVLIKDIEFVRFVFIFAYHEGREVHLKSYSVLSCTLDFFMTPSSHRYFSFVRFFSWANKKENEIIDTLH